MAVATVDEAIERMRETLTSLPADDGVARFTWMYLQVTLAVAQALDGTQLHDPAWTAALDVGFANLFFAALDAEQVAPGSSPPAWRPLFAGRRATGVLAVQFALAGMNAHVNRDLAVALGVTCEQRRVELRDPSPQHDDFLGVNRILARVEPVVRAQLVGELPADAAVRLADRIAMWNIVAARDAAWVQGEVLWQLRAMPELRTRALSGLDGVVGLASRGLLIPVL